MGFGLALVLHPLLGHQQDHGHSHQAAANDVEDRGAAGDQMCIRDSINVATKEDVPTVEKKVKDTNDSTGETSEWQDSADADIGDELEYKLTGTVSAKIANYMSKRSFSLA